MILQPSDRAAEPTAVYRFFGAGHQLLYIGMSCDLPTRFRSHRGYKSWTDVTNIEITWLPDRASAARAETEAIHTEKPPWNLIGIGASWTKGPEYPAVAADIRDQITSGALPPGTQLPFKRDLASQFGVSEQVIDAAMIVLRTEGLIEGQQGKGVYIAERPPNED